MRKLYKIHTETNKIRRVFAWNKTEVRLKAYQLFGSENFTIKQYK